MILFDDYLKEQLKDPEFRAEYEALEMDVFVPAIDVQEDDDEYLLALALEREKDDVEIE